MHGQWDWMNDPEIHSAHLGVGQHLPGRSVEALAQRRAPHVDQRDREGPRRRLRASSASSEKQTWQPATSGSPSTTRCWRCSSSGASRSTTWTSPAVRKREKRLGEGQAPSARDRAKVRRQVVKDYVLFPLLAGPHFLPRCRPTPRRTSMRNLWSNMIIFCGHFPDGAEKFTEEDSRRERADGTAPAARLGNFEGGRLFHVMCGNLGYQIEHHLFPDLPSNRYPEVAQRVRALCESTASRTTRARSARQLGTTMRTIWRLALPPKRVEAHA